MERTGHDDVHDGMGGHTTVIDMVSVVVFILYEQVVRAFFGVFCWFVGWG